MAIEEEKAENFRRLAEKRTNKIFDDFRLLGNLSNKSNYEYTDKEVDKIFDSIDKELQNTRAMFKGKSKKAKFKL